jgi:YVTN family beta-propeller protein
MDIAVSPDDKTIYVTTGRGNSVVVMDAKTLELQANVPVGKRVWGLDISRDGSTLYTADGVSGTVSVVDTASNKTVKQIDVGSFPWGIAIDD